MLKVRQAAWLWGSPCLKSSLWPFQKNMGLCSPLTNDLTDPDLKQIGRKEKRRYEITIMSVAMVAPVASRNKRSAFIFRQVKSFLILPFHSSPQMTGVFQSHSPSPLLCACPWPLPHSQHSVCRLACLKSPRHSPRI